MQSFPPFCSILRCCSVRTVHYITLYQAFVDYFFSCYSVCFYHKVYRLPIWLQAHVSASVHPIFLQHFQTILICFSLFCHLVVLRINLTKGCRFLFHLVVPAIRRTHLISDFSTFFFFVMCAPDLFTLFY